MTATPLGVTTRYFPVGTRRYYYVPAIADISAPTRVELDAGTDLTAEVVDGSIKGFELSTATVDVPDTGTDFTAQIDGRTTAAASSMEIYLSEDSDDARTLFVPKTNAHIVIFPEGDHNPVVGPPAYSYHMDVWPVRVMSVPISQDTTKGGSLTVNFAITSKPALNVAVPASA